MLSKAKSKAWQLLIEDSNRPAEEIRLATGLRVDVIERDARGRAKTTTRQPGVLIMRPSYLPVQYEHCPYCGGILNVFGDCVDCQFHDDPTEWWMDE